MKTTAEKIKIMQAYEDGEDIEVTFCDFDNTEKTIYNKKAITRELNFNWEKYLYEIYIKPKTENEKLKNIICYIFNNLNPTNDKKLIQYISIKLQEL